METRILKLKLIEKYRFYFSIFIRGGNLLVFSGGRGCDIRHSKRGLKDVGGIMEPKTEKTKSVVI